VDQSGTIRATINTSNTLPSDIIYYMAIDPAGSLWVCTDTGISQVEISSHFTTFFEGVNLNGVPNDIQRHEGTLYAATNLGLYALRKASYPQSGPKFERIPAINSTCWRLLVMDDIMLVGSTEGLFEVRGGSVRKILSVPSYDVHRYANDPTRIVIGGEFVP
jgi:hypothetical protein